MTAILWYIVIGSLLLAVGMLAPLIKRYPVSTSNIYFVVGLLLGPSALGLLSWDAVREARLLELLTEVAVIVSLFTVGLNLRRSPRDRLWLVPLRLATVAMVVTIGALALVGTLALGLPLGAAILLGALLAPTDPVLASDVQVRGAGDQDELRSSLTGEAGFNDGAAFPFVMLGLGLLGLHPDEEAGLFHLWGKGDFTLLAWLFWDVLWAVGVGLSVGAVTGWLVGKASLWLHRRHEEAFGPYEFLVLGLIALSYGVAEILYSYGFLAVFAAGYALRYIELAAGGHAEQPPELPEILPGDGDTRNSLSNADPSTSAHFLTLSLVEFNDQLEHILSAGVVLLIGGVLSAGYWDVEVLWLAPLLFLLIRPLAVAVALRGSLEHRVQRSLIAWFGIRGIGSLYYLTYAIEHGLSDQLAQRLTSLVLPIVAVSIVVHGISVTPLMSWYERWMERRAASQQLQQPDTAGS
ncbi:MAG: cation:proton antiporter [Chloroflexota bacterium]|nr:cation:proton antiporter [Chloroflexota bacterium]